MHSGILYTPLHFWEDISIFTRVLFQDIIWTNWIQAKPRLWWIFFVTGVTKRCLVCFCDSMFSMIRVLRRVHTYRQTVVEVKTKDKTVTMAD